MVLALMISTARQDSLIMDELAHIPAGYGYANYLDYRLNPEHPPLLKAASGFLMTFLRPNFPTESSAWQTEVNGQWAQGNLFLFQSGNDADRLIFLARLAPILLTLLLILFVYYWAKQLLGGRWALLPALLVGLSPNFLAQGHYVTTDIAAAFGIAVGIYYFLNFLERPSRKHLVFAGLAFGLAQLMKFSAVLLGPYFLLLILIFYLSGVSRDWYSTERGARLRRFGVRAWHYVRAAFLVFIIGYALVVYPVYFLFTRNYPLSKQVSDTEFTLTSFAGGPTPDGQTCKSMRCLADLNIWLAKHEATRPAAEYILGVLMVTQRSEGGNTAYFMGQVSAAGSHLYFPTVYLMKEPLPVLLLVLLGLYFGLRRGLRTLRDKSRKWSTKLLDYLNLNFSEFAILLFVVLYWVYSIQSPLNIGFRHLFPALPLIYLLVGSAWQKQFASGQGWRAAVKFASFFFLVFWFVAGTALAYPYYLSYFNEMAGGTGSGYRYVTDSNFDWGQDMLRLRQFVAAHPEIDKIAVDYFGGADTKYYLGDKVENWWSSRGNPAEAGIHWLAISANTLQGAIQPAAPGFDRKQEDSYPWLIASRPRPAGIGAVPPPDYKAGTSIFIYKL